MEVKNWLLKNGFVEHHGEGNYKDYDCIMRIHELHYLFWSSNLKHFAIGVLNDTGKKEAGGFFTKWKMVMIPKPVYTIAQAKLIITAVSNS